MMQRKRIIAWVIMANIVLLAHTIVPHHHHHHNEHPHFSFSCSQPVDEENDTCDSHSHKENCSLEQNRDVIYEAKKDNSGSSGFSYTYPQPLWQIAGWTSFCDFSLIREPLIFPESPHLFSYRPPFLDSGWSLRAPPHAFS